MAVSKAALRGYLLEEVLAYLIRRTGYGLLVDPTQDPRNLERRGSGLVIKGRGAVHQVDVLGQLKWIPAFTFPLRLFVEAKFRGKTTGIEVVRNAVGVLLDLNQKDSLGMNLKPLPQKYHYAYAVFSTSGFSEPAMEMALAHQISLIDLSGPEFDSLRNGIERAAEAVLDSIAPSESADGDAASRPTRGPKLVSSVRNVLRRRLGTLPEEIQLPSTLEQTLETNTLDSAAAAATEYGELFVAMANGPFMLLLKADDPAAFLNYTARHPRHEVNIRWSERINQGQTWSVTPSGDEGSYRLSFRLPTLLAEWVFEAESGDTPERALQVKSKYFSEITIYRHVNGEDHLFRLVYDAEQARQHVGEGRGIGDSQR